MAPLRALVRQTNGIYEAELVELDLCVSSTSEDGLFGAIEYALCLTYQIARERGETPFARITGMASPKVAAQWNWISQSQPAKTRPISLPEEVADALAIALHAAKPENVSGLSYAIAA